MGGKGAPSRLRAHVATVFSHSPAGRRLHPAHIPHALGSVAKPQAVASERREEEERMIRAEEERQGLLREEAQRGALASSPGEIVGAVRCIW